MSFAKPKLELKNNFMLFDVADKLVIDTFLIIIIINNLPIYIAHIYMC